MLFSIFFLSVFFPFFCIYTQTSRPSCFLSKFKVRWSRSCAAVSNPSWIWQSGSLRAASILVSSSIHFLYLRTASFFTPPDTLSHFTQQCSHHSHCFFACFILLWIFRISSLFPASVLAGCFSSLPICLPFSHAYWHPLPPHPLVFLLFLYAVSCFSLLFSFSFHSERDHCVLLSFVPPSSTAFVFSFLVLAVIEASVQTLAKVSSNVSPFHYSLLTLEVKGAQVYRTWAPKPSCSGAKRGLRMTMTCTSSPGSRCLPQALFCKSTKVMPQPSW